MSQSVVAAKRTVGDVEPARGCSAVERVGRALATVATHDACRPVAVVRDPVLAQHASAPTSRTQVVVGWVVDQVDERQAPHLRER